MTIFRKIQKYISVLLLFTLFVVMYNDSTNQHQHLLPNGQIVVHSHPFSKNKSDDPQKQHTHNTNQLFVISQINNLFWFLLILSFVFEFVKKEIKKQIVQFVIVSMISFQKINYQLRAPPIN